MAYDPQNTEELPSIELPRDSILDATIIHIEDGKVEDHIGEKAKATWKGDTTQPAINITSEVMVQGKPIRISQLFTYTEENGKTKYTKGSNLGKFISKYGRAPEAGMTVKVITNNDGFGRIKLE